TVSVSTSSDPTAVASNSYPVVAANPVSAVSAAITGPTAAAGARTGYTVSFTASSTGGMSAATGGNITFAFPAGTGLNNATASVTDTTTGKQVVSWGCCGTGSTTATLGLSSGAVVNAGDSLTATFAT